MLGARLADDIAAWVLALSGRGPAFEDNMNVPNLGQVPQLPQEAVVETRGVLDAAGYHPLASPLPRALEAGPASARPARGAHGRGRDRGQLREGARRALINPLLTGIDTARPLLEELLGANRAYLPQFK